MIKLKGITHILKVIKCLSWMEWHIQRFQFKSNKCMFKRKNDFISKMLWQFKSNKMIKLNGMTHIKSNKVFVLNGMTHTKISISRVIKVCLKEKIILFQKCCDNLKVIKWLNWMEFNTY